MQMVVDGKLRAKKGNRKYFLVKGKKAKLKKTALEGCFGFIPMLVLFATEDGREASTFLHISTCRDE